MDELPATISNYDLWMSLVKVHHSLFFLRQKELSPSHIAAQQLQVLRVIQSLGTNATLSSIAKKVERKLDVIFPSGCQNGKRRINHKDKR